MSGRRNRKRDKRNDDRPYSTPEDRRKYQEAWSKMMVDIWREKIQRLRVHDTYLLRNDITENVTSDGAHLALIQHKFMEYGIYQDCGVGRGYEHGNEGNLEFLDERYRGKEYTRKQKSGKITHGEARQPREWFSRAYFASVMVLREEMLYMYADNFVGLLANRIEEANHKRSTSMRSYLWGRRKY